MENQGEKEMLEQCIYELQMLNIGREIAKEWSTILSRIGIMHHITQRTKKYHSVRQKLRKDEYVNGEKKLQDIIGIRIDVYYVEDINICKELMKSDSMIGDWKTIDIKDSTFKPLKNNGVFYLPSKYVNMINPNIWEYGIDKTYEIQIRTISFDGWHEIEHDLRYKLKKRDEDKCVWDEQFAFEYSRRMNAIVATLELCDNEMEATLAGFAEKLYENKRWDELIRVKLRLRFTGEELLDEYKEFLSNNEEVALKLYSLTKEKLIHMFLNSKYFEKGTALTVNDVYRIVLENKDVK